MILFGYTPGRHTGFIFWFYFTLCELLSKKNCVHNTRCQLLLTDRIVVGVARAGRGEGPEAAAVVGDRVALRLRGEPAATVRVGIRLPCQFA